MFGQGGHYSEPREVGELYERTGLAAAPPGVGRTDEGGVSHMRAILFYPLAGFVLLVAMAVDVLKLPFLVIGIFPLWLLIDAIYKLRGEETNFPCIYIIAATLCTSVVLDVVGLPIPRWMDHF